MLLYVVIDSIIAALYILLAIFAMSGGGYKNAQNRTFALFSTCLMLWLVTNHMSNDTTVPEDIVVWANYLLFFSSFAAAVLLLKMVTSVAKDQKIEKIFTVAEPILWVIAVLFATPLVAAGVEPQQQVYAIVFGPLGTMYGVALGVVIAAIGFVIVRNWSHRETRVRHQIRVIGTGAAVTVPLVMLLGYIIPVITNDFAITQIALVPCIILAGAFYYATLQHGLFDMRLVVTRTMVYTLTLLTLATIYFALAYTISVVMFSGGILDVGLSTSPFSIVLAFILAFVFQPIKTFFDNMTNRLFFRASYDPEAFTAALGRIFTSTVILDELLERAADEIATTLKSSHVTFVVYGNQHDSTIKTSGTFRSLSNEVYDQVGQYIALADETVVIVDNLIDETYSHTELGTLCRKLRSRNVALILPLHGKFGYVLIGEQKASGYSQRDLRVLDSLISELSIAIQNALSIQELQELNTTLQQRIDNATSELRHTNQKLRQIDATKDEFISMASHQLRTPLTSIKGYLSMVLEGDVGKITDAQRAMLTEAFTSSERMVHLIGDFLNVSRLQTGKFTIDAKATDLAQVVQGEVDAMNRLALSHKITLNYKKPRVSPILYVDQDKLRQVIMNFIDNAIYYSPENSTVMVILSKRDGQLCLEVKDEGMGVPEEVHRRLFTKFFRADNARKQRPDGTGIGLYLAKKVILAHDGEMIFRTRKNKGSVFGFCLPIAKLSKEPALKD